MKLPFVKMSGAGNDFVAVEEAGRRADWAALAKRLCPRRSAVGADGLLVLKAGAKPSMRYFNADGSRAFCGNGARCAAWWLHLQGLGRALAFASDEGPLEARIVGPERVRLRMPAPRDLRLELDVAAAGRTWRLHSVNTGVPHAVVPVHALDPFPVVEAGRLLRRHAAFAPAGTNVNFAVLPARGGRSPIELRTYERGVEDETLACGTGVTATALVAAALGRARPPVRLKVRSGDLLTVHFKDAGAGRLPEEVWLEGPAKITYRGTVEL